MNKKLSVVLATHNEEKKLEECLLSVIDIASEIIIVDGSSTDKTISIAKEFGAKVIVRENPKMFHINKQIALEKAKNRWILQLDADEKLSKSLAGEIVKVSCMCDEELEKYQEDVLRKNKLFERHQTLIEKRDGRIDKKDGEYAGFFIPRRNFFLGKYLKYGGTYPDGVIRLVKKGKARFPCKSVHEQIEIDGKVGWLENDLLHKDSPTFKSYLERNSRYIDLIVGGLEKENLKVNLITFIDYVLIRPTMWFFSTTIRHKGVLDGWRGLVFSFFSALRFPRAYLRYIIKK